MMKAPILLTRRATSTCLSCRRILLGHFSASMRSPLRTFQSYPLASPNPQSPSRDSHAVSVDASPLAPPSHLPQVHETRPPESPHGPGQAAGEAERTSLPTTSTTTTTPTPTRTSAASRPETASASLSRVPPTRSRLRAPRKAAMRLTPSAVAQLRRLLDQPEPKLIRVGVRNRGCSGLAYHLEYVPSAGAFDETVEQDGVRVLVDSKALFSIIGSEMDWVEDRLSQKFVFRNPNIKEECGCGESFMV